MPESINTVETYLEELKDQLAGSDSALIQDALNDTRDFFHNERRAADEAGFEPEDEAALVNRMLRVYGTPAEVATAYRETERQVQAALSPRSPRPSPRPSPRRSSDTQGSADATSEAGGDPSVAGPAKAGDILTRFFGVLTDSRSYGSVFYMLLSLLTGILYFTWVTTGISLSLGLSVMIFGIPVALLFLATVRVLSLVEGRIVETLLGERMPRRAVVGQEEGSWLERIKYWIKDSRTWSTMAYMILQMPLGIVYFTLFTILLTLSLALFAAPIASAFFGLPMVRIEDFEYYPALWTLPLFWLAAGFDLLVLLHLARLVGRVHGSLAKAMLVRV